MLKLKMLFRKVVQKFDRWRHGRSKAKAEKLIDKASCALAAHLYLEAAQLLSDAVRSAPAHLQESFREEAVALARPHFLRLLHKGLVDKGVEENEYVLRTKGSNKVLLSGIIFTREEFRVASQRFLKNPAPVTDNFGPLEKALELLELIQERLPDKALGDYARRCILEGNLQEARKASDLMQHPLFPEEKILRLMDMLESGEEIPETFI